MQKMWHKNPFWKGGEKAVKEHPLIFPPELAQKIADGRKTMTRRVLKEQPPERYGCPAEVRGGWYFYKGFGSGLRIWPGNDKPITMPAPPLKLPLALSDIMWVRESFLDDGTGEPGNIHYRGAANEADLKWIAEEGWKWKPSIHMPRSLCRTTRAITEVRIERLMEISEEDVEREGVFEYSINERREVEGNIYYSGFADLWDSISKKPGTTWDDNPWVVVYGWENT